jgi:hypothetical protein
MARRESDGKVGRRVPVLTSTRYKQMLRELQNLNRKHRSHLSTIVPSIEQDLQNAQANANRLSERPKAGAPQHWTDGELLRLWVFVRAEQIRRPHSGVREACRVISKRGFTVITLDRRSVVGA